MSRILIIDDEASICYALSEGLGDDGHIVDVAASAEEGLELASTNVPDAMILDIRLPGIDGLSAIPRFRQQLGPAPIIIMTAFGNLDTAVRSVEAGAFDYLVKPFDLDQAGAVVSRALEAHNSRRRGQTVACDSPTDDEPLIGSSRPMQELFKSISLVAPTDVPILITGESGTGKELVARAIHRHSARRNGPFLPVCLPALSPSLVEPELFGHARGSFTGAIHDRKGIFELADRGTVLLDEIGDAPPSLQVKLLRAIEHKEVTPVGDSIARKTDIRVIAATNRPLLELMANSQFREDLFFRLSVFRIELPPLRERREDIPILAAHFLARFRSADSAETHLSPGVLAELRARPWNGNIRELRNTIEHAAIMARGRTIRVDHLPPALTSQTNRDPIQSPATDLRTRMAAWARMEAQAPREHPGDARLYERFLDLIEPPFLQSVLEKCADNRAQAAELLGIHRATLRQKLRRYGIQ
jgi:two-component system nitrogen regulation response regulator GlnG